jgi:hypothetical protein
MMEVIDREGPGYWVERKGKKIHGNDQDEQQQNQAV